MLCKPLLYLCGMLCLQTRTYYIQRTPELIPSPGSMPQANTSQILSDYNSVKTSWPIYHTFCHSLVIFFNGVKKFQVH